MSLFSIAEAALECSSLIDPSVANFIFSIVILLGILASYLPQHFRIISRGSSEGISPLFLLLGVTSGTCAFLNILILSWGVLGCCGKGIGPFNCIAASLGVAQVGLQWTSFAVILVLFLIYFPRPSGLPVTGPAPSSPRTAVTVAVLSILHLLVLAVVSAYFALLEPNTSTDATALPGPSPALVSWANFLGVQSTVLASLQYIPQLWTTFRLKHVGSLSIPMMLIQTPGSFIWAVSLATREGTRWSSWVTYVVTGTLQGGLLVMCICWEIKERAWKKRVESECTNGQANGESRDDEQEERSESSPLLGDER